MDREENQRNSKSERQQSKTGNWYMSRHHEAHRFADVVVDAPTKPDRMDDGTELVFDQNDGAGFARHVRATTAHRDSDVSGLQRGRIVYAVAGHGNDFTFVLQRLDDPQLLLGLNAREYCCALDTLGQSRIVKCGDIGTADHIAD